MVSNVVGEIKGNNKTLSGYYNNNYIINYNGIIAVLRIPIDNCYEMDIRLIPEYIVLDLIDGVVNAPKVLYRNNNIQIHSYIHGTIASVVYKNGAALYEKLPLQVAVQMSSLHSLGVPTILQKYKPECYENFIKTLIRHMYKVYKGFWKDYKKLFLSMDIPVDPIECIYSKILNENTFNGKWSICHCDIHKDNIIIQQGDVVSIIDWELSIIGDPLYDIATHFHKMGYTKEQEAIFLSTYGIKQESKESIHKVRGKIKMYKEIEVIKSVLVDTIRYSKIIKHDLNMADELAKDYAIKINHAYDIWGINNHINEIEVKRIMKAG